MRSSSLLALLLFLFAERAAAADCNRNGIEDYQEVVSGGSPDCDRNRVPDECDIRPANYGVAVRQRIPIGIHSQAMLPGDFDMDGLPDLAILRPGDPPFAGVSIFHNDGRGGLAQGRSYDLDRTFRSLTAADVDGDGDTDLIATGGPGASMLPNAGDGSFGLAQDLELIPDVFSVAFADIDRDGDLDIAAVTPFRLVVMRNAARGDFAEAQSLIVGSSPAVIVAVDLDGDGDEDLVTGNLFENVSVFQNGGDGVFEAGGSYAAGGGVSSLVTVDLDSDGDPDLAAGTAAGTSVLLSERDGSFRDPSVSPLRGGVFGIRVGDFDGDGDVDIAGASNAGSFAFVWNHGGGVFGPSSVDMTLARTRILEAIDLDADGTSELVVQPFQVQELLVFEKGWKPNSPDCNSDGVPDACQLFENDCNSNGIPDDCDIATGAALDCNSNGRPDQCDEDCNENRIPDDCDLSGGSSQDCNRNEVPDECDVRPGVRFEPPVTLDLARVHRSLLLDDLDGDGDQDIAAFLAGGALRVFLNDGRGAFDQLPDQVASGVRAGPITDLDGDGDLDIVVISIDRRIRAFLSDGGGVFSAGLSIELEEPLEPMGVGDFDGDGKLDVVGSGDGELVVVSFEVDGAFHRRASIPIAEPSPPHLAVSDLDADGARTSRWPSPART